MSHCLPCLTGQDIRRTRGPSWLLTSYNLYQDAPTSLGATDVDVRPRVEVRLQRCVEAGVLCSFLASGR